MQPLISSSENVTAQQVLDGQPDKSNQPPTLSWALMLLLPLSAHWRNIGAMLELDNDELRKISTDYKVVDDCLREMLCLWLKQVKPQPTRKALAEAVRVYDPKRAEKILD